MTNTVFQDFDCDLCGSPDAAEIEVTRHYGTGGPIHVCKNCGFVYVRRRRTADSIADEWSDGIYQKGYTARFPGVKARQTYVADFIDSSLGLNGKTVCDIGAGEGRFLEIIEREHGAKAFAIEPSKANCRMMEDSGIEIFAGTIEDFQASALAGKRAFDLATIVWTLENCQSCRFMLDAAHDVLKDDGYLAVATGSRILVPFKKPMHYYLGSLDPTTDYHVTSQHMDTHAFRFSANTMQGLFAVSGFEVTHVNRYIDTDYLVVIGRKIGRSRDIRWQGDDWRAVIDHFERWHKDTQNHFKDA